MSPRHGAAAPARWSGGQQAPVDSGAATGLLQRLLIGRQEVDAGERRQAQGRERIAAVHRRRQLGQSSQERGDGCQRGAALDPDPADAGVAQQGERRLLAAELGDRHAALAEGTRMHGHFEGAVDDGRGDGSAALRDRVVAQPDRAGAAAQRAQGLAQLHGGSAQAAGTRRHRLHSVRLSEVLGCDLDPAVPPSARTEDAKPAPPC